MIPSGPVAAAGARTQDGSGGGATPISSNACRGVLMTAQGPRPITVLPEDDRLPWTQRPSPSATVNVDRLKPFYARAGAASTAPGPVSELLLNRKLVRGIENTTIPIMT